MLRRWQSARLVLLSVLGGVLIGLLATLLRLGLGVLTSAASAVTGYAPPGTPGEGGLMMSFGTPQALGLLLLPALGALYVWLMPRDGEALNQMVRVGLGKRSDADERWALDSEVQTLSAAALASAGGLLVGRDAAFAALGRLGTRLLGLLTRLSAGEHRTLVLATTAAALGAVLHAPLAAAVLVAEVLYRRFEFEYEVLMSCVLAAITAYAVYGTVFGFRPLFQPPVMDGLGMGDLLPGLLITLVATALAWLVLRLSDILPQPRFSTERLAAGAGFGALSAVLVLLVGPQVLGDGSGWMALGLNGMLDAAGALETAGWRWLLLALGAGLAFGAGVLPSLALGGLLGAGLGGLLGGDPALGTLLGAAAFLTVTHNTPVAATLLAVAWGGDAVLPAALLAAGLAHLLSGEVGLLPAQVASRSRRAAEADAAALVLAEAEARRDQGSENGERQIYRRAVPSTWGGVAIGRLALPPSVEVVGLVRDGEVLLPRRSVRLLRGDEVMLLARPDAYAALDALLELPELR
ncbi:Cl- channel voltage-gated family protein [Deinococcus radiophilus]|uniref:Cl-channel voltage-gated family protein n=1 Tax=Deinococcus radiophilus TaxID=32062 RepID=A0A3S0LAS9_9DEIO|nr:Cl- channel voltage-gated family protein [Deinococcus radiophilus]